MTRSSLTLLLVATLVFATPAHGQVIEIDGEGGATVYDAPTIFAEEGNSPVLYRPKAESQAHWSLPSAAISVAQIEREYNLPSGLVDAVIYQESRGRMNAVSSKGALGLMQLMPGTAAQLGVNPYLADQNVRGGAMYLRQQIDRFGSIPLGLAAYNAGPGAVIRYRGIPPYRETQNYVATIMGRWQPLVRTGTAAAVLTAIAAPLPSDANTFFIEVTDQ